MNDIYTIVAFGSENAAKVKCKEFRKHYGARPVQIRAWDHPEADSRGYIWCIVRDGEHYYRTDGTFY